MSYTKASVAIKNKSNDLAHECISLLRELLNNEPDLYKENQYQLFIDAIRYENTEALKYLFLGDLYDGQKNKPIGIEAVAAAKLTGRDVFTFNYSNALGESDSTTSYNLLKQLQIPVNSLNYIQSYVNWKAYKIVAQGIINKNFTQEIIDQLDFTTTSYEMVDLISQAFAVKPFKNEQINVADPRYKKFTEPSEIDYNYIHYLVATSRNTILKDVAKKGLSFLTTEQIDDLLVMAIDDLDTLALLLETGYTPFDDNKILSALSHSLLFHKENRHGKIKQLTKYFLKLWDDENFRPRFLRYCKGQELVSIIADYNLPITCSILAEALNSSRDGNDIITSFISLAGYVDNLKNFKLSHITSATKRNRLKAILTIYQSK